MSPPPPGEWDVLVSQFQQSSFFHEGLGPYVDRNGNFVLVYGIVVVLVLSSCSAFWIEVERALCGRWKTRDGARVPPGISKAKPLSSKNSSLEKSIRFHLKKQKRSPDALFAPGTFVL